MGSQPAQLMNAFSQAIAGVLVQVTFMSTFILSTGIYLKNDSLIITICADKIKQKFSFKTTNSPENNDCIKKASQFNKNVDFKPPFKNCIFFKSNQHFLQCKEQSTFKKTRMTMVFSFYVFFSFSILKDTDIKVPTLVICL